MVAPNEHTEEDLVIKEESYSHLEDNTIEKDNNNIQSMYVLCVCDFVSIDDNEFILLNLEGPLTSKQPTPDDSIGAFATINMGYK